MTSRAPNTTPNRVLSQQVTLGALWSGISWGFGILVGLPLTVLLVRAMSSRSYGNLAIASTVIDIGAALGGLGLTAAVAQRASALRLRLGEEQATREAVLAARRLAIPATGALLAALPFVGLVMVNVSRLSAAWPATAVMWPTIMIAPLAATFTGALVAGFAGSRATLAQLTTTLATTALTVLVVIVHARSALDIGVARAAGGVAGFVVLAVVAPSAWLRLRPLVTRSTTAGSIASFAAAMLLTTVAWRTVSQLDVLIVGLDRGPTAASLYLPASRIADFALAFTTPLAMYVLPAITQARLELGLAEVCRLYHWSSRWSLLLSAPVLAVTIGSPAAMLRILFGVRYAAVAGPARILGIAAAVHVLFGFNGLTLDAHGVPKVAAIRSGVGVLTSVVACAVLIPPFGLSGAAIATLAAIVVLNASSSWTLARRFGVSPWDRRLAATAIAFVASVVGAAMLVRSLQLPAFWSCVLAAGLSTAATFLASQVLAEAGS